MEKIFHPHRLSTLQRLAAVPYFAIGALLDPTRGDLVAGDCQLLVYIIIEFYCFLLVLKRIPTVLVSRIRRCHSRRVIAATS